MGRKGCRGVGGKPLAGGSASESVIMATEDSSECPTSPEPVVPLDQTNVGPKSGTRAAPQRPKLGNAANTASALISSESVEKDKAEKGKRDNDALENEVVHFMTLLMEEKSKSEALATELGILSQQKDDVEQQLSHLQEQLDEAFRVANQAEQAGASSAAEAHDMITGLKTEIDRLGTEIDETRTKGQVQTVEVDRLTAEIQKSNSTVAELEGQLQAVNDELTGRKQQESSLQQKLGRLCQGLETLKSGHCRDWDQDEGEVTPPRECTKQCGSASATLTELTELDGAVSVLETLVEESIAVQRQREKSQRQKEDLLARQMETVEQEKDQEIEALAEKLRQSETRRVRIVVICVDLSGSLTGSLAEGAKIFYRHLIDHLRQAPVLSRVMTIVHGGIGPEPRVKSDLDSLWHDHETALAGEAVGGSENHTECLIMIEERLRQYFLHPAYLQVVLIGDGMANDIPGTYQPWWWVTSHSPPIHSVIVQTGEGGEDNAHDDFNDYYETFNHDTTRTRLLSAKTGGKNIYWGMDTPLPDLTDFLL